jgi:mono/diheme cytochrome c family protein
MAFALQEEVAVANRLFEQVDADVAATSRISELLTQLAVAPDRKDAADELRRLSDAAGQPNRIELERSGVARRENAGLTAADLYALYCDACHGADGDGNGRAARHQFPRPRDLRTEAFRLVSTDNGNPTVEDLEQVIKRGMPGTSMRAFDLLSKNQLRRLAEEVLRIRRAGVRDWYVALLRAEEEEIDEQDVQQVVDLRSLPGALVKVPAIGPADPAAAARQRDVYLEFGCRTCHGDDSTGAPEVAVFDQHGLPVWPRDLVYGPFKGGHEPEAIGLRILAGMPGSPHPAAKTLSDRQCVDLIHYCGSLSRQPKRTLTNHQRFLEATRRPLPSVVPEATADTNGTAGGCP